MESMQCQEIDPDIEEYFWKNPDKTLIPCKEANCTELGFCGFDRCWEHWGWTKCKQKTCGEGTLLGFHHCMKHACMKFRCKTQGCNAKTKKENMLCEEHRIKKPVSKNSHCPNCIDWIDSRCRNKKYDGWCARCFKDTFPNDPRSKIGANRKELLVRKRINDEFDGFIHDRTMYTGNCDCTHRRRIDHRKIINNTMIAVETDEFAHRSYDRDDEIIRYDDLYMIFSGKWIYIRFNPDDNRSKVHFEDKLNTLIDTIRKCIQRIENEENDDLVDIIRLFH